jgi:hypothetical protein
MSIDITQQALNALADAGLGNDSPAEAERLAMRLHEQVGDCPIAHESGNAMDDSEREWWVNLAASAWTLIDGTEETE